MLDNLFNNLIIKPHDSTMILEREFTMDETMKNGKFNKKNDKKNEKTEFMDSVVIESMGIQETQAITEEPIISKEIQIEAVKQNGLAIEYIKNPSKEIQLEAVKQNGNAIKYITRITEPSADVTANLSNERDDDMEEESDKRTRGARDKFFICSAIGKQGIILVSIKAETQAEAETLFLAHPDNTEQKPAQRVLSGLAGKGYYSVKGTGVSEAQRESVSVAAHELVRRTNKIFSGEYKGWKVWGSCLKAPSQGGYKDNELASIEFSERVDSNSKLPKPKLKKIEVIPISLISNIKYENC